MFVNKINKNYNYGSFEPILNVDTAQHNVKSDVIKSSDDFNVITSQPKSHSEMEQYVLDVDIQQASLWTMDQVCDLFLDKIGMGAYAEVFRSHRIQGKSLPLLNDEHLGEMGIQPIGDRVFIQEMIQLLQKKRRQMNSNLVLWKGDIPSKTVMKVCPCMTRVEWKVTSQGVHNRRIPCCGKYCGTTTNDYTDYRFFKDVELKEYSAYLLYCCPCITCCRRYKLELYVEDESNRQSSRQSSRQNPSMTTAMPTAPHVIRHPDALTAERIIRKAWAKARLVSGAN